MQQVPKKTEQKEFFQDWETGTLSRLGKKDGDIFLNHLIKKVYFFLGLVMVMFFGQLAYFINKQENGWSLVLQSLRDTFLH